MGPGLEIWWRYSRSTMVHEPNPDIARWNEKYRKARLTGGPVVPKGESELVDNSSLLPGSGLALEAACGKGANALYLAEQGYEVVACDLAINGLAQVNAADTPAISRVMPTVCDLAKLPFADPQFSLVCVIRFLDRGLFRAVASWLRPGGVLFYKTFNRDYLEIHPRFNPDYLVVPGELNSAFPNVDILVSDSSPSHRVSPTQAGSSYIIGRMRD